VLGTDGIKRQAALLRTAIPDRFTLWQQPGLLPASPERPADSGDPGAAGERPEASPAAYAGQAALPAVTDQMLQDALPCWRIRCCWPGRRPAPTSGPSVKGCPDAAGRPVRRAEP
jgi:hypothetical protein